MLDLHAHILPGLDDGPKTWDDAIAMLKAAAEDGITGIAATPHVKHGMFVSPMERVLELTEEINRRAAELFPDKKLKVFSGSEITVSMEALSGLKEGRFCSYNRGRYVLLELPSHFSPTGINNFLDSVSALGLLPVIAHPERNPHILSDVEPLYSFAAKGALMQVTAGSFTGFFGAEVKNLAMGLLERELVHLVASDAHSPKHRPPALSDAFKLVSSSAGEEKALELFKVNTQKVIDNEPITPAPPKRIKKPEIFIFDPASFDF